MIQYAIVQGTMRTVLLRLLSINGPEGAILVHGMADEVVSKKMQIALADKGKKFKKFYSALACLYKIAQFRNRLVHWMPSTNQERTTLSGIVDILRDHRNANQPQLRFAPIEMRRILNWLKAFELDLLTLMLAIDQGEQFVFENYVTLDDRVFPKIPKAGYWSTENGRRKKTG